MDFGKWLETVQFYETLLTFHEKILGKKKDAFIEKKKKSRNARTVIHKKM